jgi:hypothetical protein
MGTLPARQRISNRLTSFSPGISRSQPPNQDISRSGPGSYRLRVSECSHRVSDGEISRYLSHRELILPSLLPLPPDLLVEPFVRDLEPLVTTLQRIHVLSLYKLEI